MKNNYAFLGNLIVYLPVLYMALIWDHLPAKLPVHFNEASQADQFVTWQTWMWMLLNMLILLVIFRMSIISILSKRPSLANSQRVGIHLLTAAFVASILMADILQTTIGAPIYSDYLPVILTFFCAGGLYFAVSSTLELNETNQLVTIPPRRLAALQHIHVLSRYIMVRANLIAAIIMLLARSSDRWMIGILANLLGFAGLALLAYQQLKEADD